MTLDGERLLTPVEVAVLRHLVGLTTPVGADQLAADLERKRSGVTRALGGLDALGYAVMRDDPARWELTERGRMVALRIAASHSRSPRSVP